ncbi:MAG: copper amine oxidase N-terminal domain-containing protein [Lachnospirales bacterium]
MKKLFVLLIMIILCFSSYVLASDENAVDYHNNITINGYYSNSLQENDIININGNTYIFANFTCAELLGVEVKRQGDKISFTRVDKEINMYLGSDKFVAGNEVLKMNCKVIEIDNKAYVPLKNLAVSLGYKVEWNGDTKIINIDTNGVIAGRGFVIIPLLQISNLSIDYDKVYEDNYCEKYRYLFEKMFSKGYDIESEDKLFVERFDNEGKSGTYKYVYTKTKIRYKDFENNDKFFELPNNKSIEKNIEDNIMEIFEEYYKDKYFNDINCKIRFYFVGNEVYTSDKSKNAYKNYVTHLSDVNYAVDISNINLGDVFKVYPINCDINIYLENNDKDIEEIVSNILSDTNNSANIIYSVYSDNENQYDYRKRYVGGKLYNENLDRIYYNDPLYDIYENSIYKCEKVI